jgi:hypothetical protein
MIARGTYEQQAEATRAKIKDLMELARIADIVAAFVATAPGKLMTELLQKQVSAWESGRSWGPLDDDAKREQGKALRSKDLLGYFMGAKETAEKHRKEASDLAGVLERAAEAGRISRA